MRRSGIAFLSLLLTSLAYGQSWPQWGRSPQHDNATSVAGRHLDRVVADLVLDPFASVEIAQDGGDLGVHYAVPLVDGDDLFVVTKSGALADVHLRETQVWHVVDLRRDGLTTRWTYTTDWRPVPWGATVNWENVYHPAVTSTTVWAEGLGGTIDEIDRGTGERMRRFNPFGATIDPTIFAAGPPVIDASGNVFYTAVQLDLAQPWTADSKGAWLVRIGADGTIATVSFDRLVQNAPAAGDLCTTNFAISLLPFPPAPDAVAPQSRCGPQRPGINVAPAVAADGTIYLVSRAHLNDRWGYLVAVNANMTPRWTASLRNRFNDGCNVTIPPNGTPGGCRAGAMTGVDPAENQPGSGRVLDNASSSPVVLPDGNILYGAFTRYNYSEGHLMVFGPDGQYRGSYGWGWDITPAVYRHGATYSIVTKENHYDLGSYCGNDAVCPPDRTATTPNDPAAFFITQLTPALLPEWKVRSTNTMSCTRGAGGTLACTSDRPDGFEWCVNAIAVDNRGVVYANSEDGSVYAIAQGGIVWSSMFLRLATGAAYTPISIDGDGKIYTQNAGELFVIDASTKRRAVRRR